MPPSAVFLAELFGLDDQVAIVTGGMGRLGGRYVARARRGRRVGRGLRPAGPRQSARRRTPSPAGRPVSTHDVDVTSRAAVDAAIADVARRFGTPTILINNAGLGSSPADTALETGRFERYPEPAWDAMIDSHLKSALVMSQSFVAQFRASARRPPVGQHHQHLIDVRRRLAGSVCVRLPAPGRRGVLQAGRLQRREVGRAELHALARGILRAVRRPREHARPRRRPRSRITRRSSSPSTRSARHSAGWRQTPTTTARSCSSRPAPRPT